MQNPTGVGGHWMENRTEAVTRSLSYPHVDVCQTHLEFIILKIIKSLLMHSTVLLFNGFIKYAYCFTALL